MVRYTSNSPASRFDTLGLRDPDDDRDPAYCGITSPAAPSTCAQTCPGTCSSAQVLAEFRATGAGGLVICANDGCRCACANPGLFPGGPPGSAEVISQRCVLAHEEVHVRQDTSDWCMTCSAPSERGVRALGYRDVCGVRYRDEMECEAYARQVLCLWSALVSAECSTPVDCQAVQQALVNAIVTACTTYGCNLATSVSLAPLHPVFRDTVRRACPTVR